MDRVGDDICGRCSSDPRPSGEKIDATGESVERAAGELGSEIVWYVRSGGVTTTVP